MLPLRAGNHYGFLSLLRTEVPGIPVIFRNGAVTGEQPGFCDIHKTPSAPAHGVGGILVEAGAEQRFNLPGEQGIALQQPAAFL